MPPTGPLETSVRELIHATIPTIHRATKTHPDSVDSLIAEFLASLPKNPTPSIEHVHDSHDLPLLLHPRGNRLEVA